MKTRTFAALSMVVTLALLAAVATAETRYVSLKGSHQPPFTTWETAAKDIQSAIDVASTGDQIVVASGTYAVGATVKLNKQITVRSKTGARTTILDGSESSRRIRCLTITAIPAIFDGFTVTGFDEGIRFETREDTLSVVRNCVVVGNRSHGIFFNHGGCAKNCTVAYNGGAGLYAYDMGGGGDDPDNLILFGNQQQFVRKSANIRLQNSFTDDPHFVSAKDLRLRPDSPCIDAGANEAWMTDAIDADGGRRIQNGKVDIGAYEYTSQDDRSPGAPKTRGAIGRVIQSSRTPSTRLYVRTIAPGADIKLNGKPSGASDRLFKVPPGVKKMTVEVELDRHYPRQQTVEIHGGRITRVVLELEKQPPPKSREPDAKVLSGPAGHEGRVWCVAFAPDGALLASGGEDKTIRLWDPVSGELRRALAGHTRCVNCLAFSPDGTLLASGSHDGTVRLWRVAERKPPHVVRVSLGEIRPGLIGRTTVHGHDIGLLFKYELGKPLPHAAIQEKVFKHGGEMRDVKITLRGLLHVPRAMTVLAWHAGGSASGGVHWLHVDGREVGSIGDDRTKNTVYRLPLKAGEYPIKWMLTGGNFGNSVIQFLDPDTREPLQVSIPHDVLTAARAAPIKEVVTNYSEKPLLLPTQIASPGPDDAAAAKPPNGSAGGREKKTGLIPEHLENR